jgi:GT2 family glycosyltransferase
VCVINYNGEDYLQETLAALGRVTAEVGEVLVIDSASTDGSVELLEDRRDIELVRLSENRGPGRARNVGWAQARHGLVLFVDNDVAVEPDCPARLISALQEEGATFAMPRILYADEPGTIQYEGAASHFTGLLRCENADRPQSACPEVVRPIQSLITACFLADRERWGDGPPFDEELFYLLEDHELGLRARIAGHEIRSVPTARCFHRAGTPGLSLRLTGQYADVRIENLIRNRWLVVLKNYRARSLVVLAPVLLLFELFQLAGALKKGWFARWVSSFLWLLSRLGHIRRERRRVQRGRVVPDREILSGGPIPFSSRLAGGRLESTAARALDRTAQAYWTVAQRWL